MSNATPFILFLGGRATIVRRVASGNAAQLVQVSRGNASPMRFVESGIGTPAIFSITFEVETTAWESAVVTNGGTVSFSQKVVINNFIVAEKAAGTWALTDDYLGLWGENAPQALTSLKQLRLASAVNSPTFTASRNYTFNGTTNYIDTGFIPTTHAVAMTATNIRIGVYERTNVTGNTYTAGCLSSSNRVFNIRPRSGASSLVSSNASAGTFTLVPANDSRGFATGSRNGADATTAFAYKNGVLLTRTAAPAAFGASLPLVSVFIGGYNSGGVLTGPRASVCGLVVVGAALSDVQEASQYANIQRWAAAIGAIV